MNATIKKKIELLNLVFVSRNGINYMMDKNTREVRYISSDCFKLIEELTGIQEELKKIK